MRTLRRARRFFPNENDHEPHTHRTAVRHADHAQAWRGRVRTACGLQPRRRHSRRLTFLPWEIGHPDLPEATRTPSGSTPGAFSFVRSRRTHWYVGPGLRRDDHRCRAGQISAISIAPRSTRACTRTGAMPRNDPRNTGRARRLAGGVRATRCAGCASAAEGRSPRAAGAGALCLGASARAAGGDRNGLWEGLQPRCFSRIGKGASGLKPLPQEGLPSCERRQCARHTWRFAAVRALESRPVRRGPVAAYAEERAGALREGGSSCWREHAARVARSPVRFRPVHRWIAQSDRATDL